jgi:hypothetical protein
VQNISQKILVVATVLLGLLVIVLVVLTFRKGFSERPTLDDTVEIRSTIEGFIDAKDIKERSSLATGSSQIERDLRSYVLVPFDRREILHQKINIDNVWLNEETGNKEAQVEQELEYQSEPSQKITRLAITYQLEKETKWLINDFEAKVIER